VHCVAEILLHAAQSAAGVLRNAQKTKKTKKTKGSGLPLVHGLDNAGQVCA
jgi:hypothetical protein